MNFQEKRLELKEAKKTLGAEDVESLVDHYYKLRDDLSRERKLIAEQENYPVRHPLKNGDVLDKHRAVAVALTYTVKTLEYILNIEPGRDY
jgi:hypothetical protein